MNEILNIFENDAFSLASMSEGISKVDTVPDQLGRAGIFMPDPIRTNLMAFEIYNGTVTPVPVTRRGDPMPKRQDGTRKKVHFETVRVAEQDVIRADELAFVTMINDPEQKIRAVQQEIARRQAGPDGLMGRCETTLELMRLGAISGKLLDHAGNTLYDFFSELEETEAAVLYLDIANTLEGEIRSKIENNVVRHMRRNAKGARFTGIGAICGEQAWDKLMASKEFRERYKATEDAKALHEATVGTTVNFAGVEWEEYFGTDDNSTVALAADEIRFFPKGGNVYRHVLSPGETFGDLGTLGQPWYSRVIPDRDRDTHVTLEMMTYPLFVNTRPGMIRKGSSNAA